MKKLLIILTLGLMFGQTKLETRVYELSNYSIGGAWNCEEIFTLSSLTGLELEYAMVKIINIDANTGSWGNSGVTPTIVVYTNSNTEETMSVDTAGRITGQVQEYSHNEVKATSEYDEMCIMGTNNNINLPINIDITLLVTAEFPIEDSGYMEEDFDFCINEGLNLVSYPCENDIAINDALPSEISNNLSSIVGEGVAGVNVNGTWVGSLTQLQAGSGYWFKSSIEACFNYECAEN